MKTGLSGSQRKITFRDLACYFPPHMLTPKYVPSNFGGTPYLTPMPPAVSDDENQIPTDPPVKDLIFASPREGEVTEI